MTKRGRKKNGKITEVVAYRVPPEIAAEIRKLAERETRTHSNMLAVLVREALEARK